jgi:hypothetical protein
MDQKNNHPSLPKHRGSCHCGALRFEVEVDLQAGVSRCNCSICTKLNHTTAIARPDALVVLSSEELGEYAFGGRTARRYFCKLCGVHGFLRGHLPELGGDYVAVNVNTLDGVEIASLRTVYWDGRHDNWDAGPRDQPWPIAAAA